MCFCLSLTSLVVGLPHPHRTLLQSNEMYFYIFGTTIPISIRLDIHFLYYLCTTLVCRFKTPAPLVRNFDHQDPSALPIRLPVTIWA